MAGYNNTGSGNIFIGNYAGYSETGSDKLYIDNSSTGLPLIFGDFSSDFIKINGNLGVKADQSLNYRLTLPNDTTLGSNGGKGIAYAWVPYSSIRWKENIRPIDDPLNKVDRLRGVYFDWKGGKQHDLGMIAEEVGNTVPEIVSYEENRKDATGLDYGRLVALLVEVLKEQQKEIEGMEREIEEFKAKR